ncbi:hypothetical protein LZ32DRAFT_673503, partial [Colletotrichum eremochloae]
SSFKDPIIYRVLTRSNSPKALGSIHHSRMYPAPALEDLSISSMSTHIKNHAFLYNRIPTPFISATTDLLRALALLFCKQQEESAELILISSSLLPYRSYAACNDVRCAAGLVQKCIYNTEVLIWEEIPNKSIIHRWSQKDILESGLMQALPSLTRIGLKPRVAELRRLLREDSQRLSAVSIAKALVRLGMDPERLWIKQIFVFLLGTANGHEVEKQPKEAEQQLEATFPKAINDFDKALHDLAVLTGKKLITDYYKTCCASYNTSAESYLREGIRGCDRDRTAIACKRRMQAKLWALLLEECFCPDFDSWRARRDELHDIEGDLDHKRDKDMSGLRGWMVAAEKSMSRSKSCARLRSRTPMRS